MQQKYQGVFFVDIFESMRSSILFVSAFYPLFYQVIIISSILFVDLVSDSILQMALGSDLLRMFGGRILRTFLANAICCTLRQLATMLLSTKRIERFQNFLLDLFLKFMNCP